MILGIEKKCVLIFNVIQNILEINSLITLYQVTGIHTMPNITSYIY